jgi:dihydropteroate synthase-like protein
VQIHVLPISIAAFLTAKFVIDHIKKLECSPFKMIIVPGLMQGSTQPIEDAIGIPTFKGPRYASDLPLILEGSISLSHDIPADKLFINRGMEEYDKAIKKLEEAPSLHPFIPIKGYRIGIDYPPHILAEIVDAPRFTLPQIISKCKYFLKNGAHFLDIGAIVGQNNAKFLGKVIEEVKSKFSVPVSIDSMLPEEIEAAVEAGADIILSLDAGNMNALKNLPKDRIVTIIPTNTKEGIFPKLPEKRVILLSENIENAKKIGFNNILADPLLESPINPGLMKSLETFVLFRKKDPNIPFLFGAGNVTELIDADSTGINAILACIAVELGVSVILTTEYSIKTRKTIDELATAVKMGFFASYKKRPPIALPFHLLRAKNKKKIDQVRESHPDQSLVITDLDESYSPDPIGYFKIWVEQEDQLISVLHFQNSQPHILIQGTSAEALGKKILNLNLIHDPNHILYLGRELERAEIAMFLGKDYIQDLKFNEVF